MLWCPVHCAAVARFDDSDCGANMVCFQGARMWLLTMIVVQVRVLDHEVITVIGDNPATVELGSTYIEDEWITMQTLKAVLLDNITDSA